MTKTDDRIEDAAGAEIQLLPVNAYTTEIVQREFAKGIYLAPPDPRYRQYIRRVHADENGNFCFTHLPPGEYYVGGRIDFVGHSVTTYDDGSTQEFEEPCYTWNYNKVFVKDGQTAKIESWYSGPERIKRG